MWTLYFLQTKSVSVQPQPDECLAADDSHLGSVTTLLVVSLLHW